MAKLIFLSDYIKFEQIAHTTVAKLACHTLRALT